MKALPRGRAHRHGRSLTEVAEIDVLVHNAAVVVGLWGRCPKGSGHGVQAEPLLLPWIRGQLNLGAV